LVVNFLIIISLALLFLRGFGSHSGLSGVELATRKFTLAK
jgi:hypothetical protein